MESKIAKMNKVAAFILVYQLVDVVGLVVMDLSRFMSIDGVGVAKTWHLDLFKCKLPCTSRCKAYITHSTGLGILIDLIAMRIINCA